MRYRQSSFATELPDALPTGPRNLITDVPGLAVGHETLTRDEPTILRTGVTALTIEDVARRPVAAASFVHNGFGKSMGLVQIDELGTMESPVYFTNTLSIGAVQQGAVRVALRDNPDLRSYNAVVMECNDGRLSDIGALAVTPEMAMRAHDAAQAEFDLGSVGAGTGMICFGFKGGIGSASRRVTNGGREFTVGAMVLSNFGRAEDLRIPGSPWRFRTGPGDGAGSLILVVGTDAPLLPHQLQRVARHMPLAIGLLGSAGSHGSGDIALAFSTTMRLGGSDVFSQREIIASDGAAMTWLFRAAAWSCAEAILDSMLVSPAMAGHRISVDSLRDRMNDTPVP